MPEKSIKTECIRCLERQTGNCIGLPAGLMFEITCGCGHYQSMKPEVKDEVFADLKALEQVVHKMLQTWEHFPELNDELDIADIIPCSIDEWHSRIAQKIDVVEKFGRGKS